MIETTVQDILYGTRMFLKKPGFTAVAALMLALGIGSATAIFTIANAVLLRPLPYEGADRLVLVWETSERRELDRASVTGATYTDWEEQAQSFEAIAAFQAS